MFSKAGNIFKKLFAELCNTLRYNIKHFFKDKGVAFYMALGAAVLSLVAAILYAAVYGSMETYMSWTGFVFMLLSVLSFFALSLVGLAKYGAGGAAIFGFVGLILSLGDTYGYFTSFAVSGGIPAVLGDDTAVVFIACAAMLLVSVIASCVAAWMPQKKQDLNAVEAGGEK